VELADNLASASLVLLVEGEEDARLFNVWLPKLSAVLSSALSSRNLAIDTLNGAANLRYKLGLHKTNLCGVHAFMDNDHEGRTAIEGAKAAHVLEESEYQAAVCQGMNDSELEDFLLDSSYEEALRAAFGVMLLPKFMSTNKKDWSERIRDNFQNQGKPWTKSLERHVKMVVSTAAAASGLNSLNEYRRGPIDALVGQLERRLAAN
jgi:hypothetical protein